MSIDVEDWFHLLELESTPDIGRWAALESRVERTFLKLLEEFDETGAKVTCFFLGWVAERFPELVRQAHSRGHEVASHGYGHQLVYTQSKEEFASDIRRSKAVLEDITGSEVSGYRAPGFSITEQTLWAFDEIASAGFKYDSSVFPAARGHGGIRDGNIAPYWVETGSGPLLELPMSVLPVLGQRLFVFGGGYLRLTPYRIIELLSRSVNRSGRPVIYYLHPREIDPGHPRLSMGRVRRFKSYVNMRSTMPKLRRLLRSQQLVPFREWLAENELAYGHDKKNAPLH
jgi:polysaccharide deacetylase family protein (PEP-CTERM system associated)